MKQFVKNWWNWLKYEPTDPRFFAGRSIKVVVIGGGTGLSTLLRGLKRYSNQISAIVTVTDDGASSGRIRKDFSILPPGDIRKCISALAYDEELVSKIFEHRFSAMHKNFGGHSLGNIWITALSDFFGSFEKAIEATSQIFNTAGEVLPATLNDIELCAEFTDGRKMTGESKFVKSGKIIKKVYLNKKNVRAYRKAALAISEADMILFGPGSLFTSVIPNILIRGIKDAVKSNKRAMKIYIANCSTERGETEHYSVDDHIRAFKTHAGGQLFDLCLVNKKVLKKSINDSKLGEVNNITTKKEVIDGVVIVKDDIVSKNNPLYHDSDKLAKAVIEMYNKYKVKS